jgi:hypothetical protein
MNKQDIARLIIDIYNAGKEDGHDNGYEKGYKAGYEEAYDRAFTAGQQDGIAQVAGLDEDEEEEEDQEGPDFEQYSPEDWYDTGWNDGYHGVEPDEQAHPVYMLGYRNGREAEQHFSMK